MNSDKAKKFESDIRDLAVTILLLAQNHKNDTSALLNLLRMLEALHREIRDELFQETLPTNRRALYTLLRQIEVEGGWPYIPRMKLKSLLDCLQLEEALEDTDKY
ncbi:MAG TPA: hypothetical protein V6D03_04160 [Candidatus Caenarcaniphilales bacterium]